MTSKYASNTRPVNQRDSNTRDLIASFTSINEAYQHVDFKSGIGLCCRGKIPTAGGFIWEYADDYVMIYTDDISDLTDDIVQMYIEERMSLNEIRQILCKTKRFVSRKAVQKLLIQNNVQIRTKNDDRRSFIRCLQRKCKTCDADFTAKTSNERYCEDCRFLKRRGISQAHFNSMYEHQNGKCALCSKVLEKYGNGCGQNKWTRCCIDHNHETGKIRGLLCGDCNITLGHIESKASSWLQVVADYLGRTL